LSEEKIPFLNPRRARHFLAAIAPALLAEIARTPQPDQTLIALDNVSSSLGGKATLWELFSYNRPSMALYVKLCATCRYLTDILTRNPGMIDGLLDSLTLKSLPGPEHMEQLLAELTPNVDDLAPILNSFKNHMHLGIGVRDILARDDVRATHKALADVAELCLRTVAQRETQKLIERFGQPSTADGQPCELVILAMGKLAGREPNYHSDLDVIFLYEHSGTTRHADSSRQTSNQHFFSELGTRIVKSISSAGPYGKLYELDCRLRPTGKSGSLAVSYEEFLRYFQTGSGQTWERLALCKARPITGSPAVRREAAALVYQALTARPWKAEWAEEIRQMRFRMQEGASPDNLKRGEGGTVDIEFIVQMLQLRHAAHRPTVVRPGTIDGLLMLSQLRVLSMDDCRYLIRSYQMLRTVEARIRLMNATARHDFPEDEVSQAKLAYLFGRDNPQSLRREVARYRQENRAMFERISKKCQDHC
jgi:glutamate-ammonia-ligase adenylyltransferase